MKLSLSLLFLITLQDHVPSSYARLRGTPVRVFQDTRRLHRHLGSKGSKVKSSKDESHSAEDSERADGDGLIVDVETRGDCTNDQPIIDVGWNDCDHSSDCAGEGATCRLYTFYRICSANMEYPRVCDEDETPGVDDSRTGENSTVIVNPYPNDTTPVIGCVSPDTVSLIPGLDECFTNQGGPCDGRCRQYNFKVCGDDLAAPLLCKPDQEINDGEDRVEGNDDTIIVDPTDPDPTDPDPTDPDPTDPDPTDPDPTDPDPTDPDPTDPDNGSGTDPNCIKPGPSSMPDSDQCESNNDCDGEEVCKRYHFNICAGLDEFSGTDILAMCS